ncbi:MAG: arabinan endo-1,5-alpha-L-arabinosidase, partial [Lachnospiraceae bacterium]|nr:arabinan endo-1,5-alpha-L-arabinosidase [Lachnospiraceae bacterium]
MKKKLISTMLCICMATSVCACGQTTQEQAEDTKETETSEETGAAEETKEEVERPVLEVNYDGIATGTVNARVAVHDPSIIKADGKYYIFGSHMVGASTDDLRSWTRLGNGYTETNTIYGNLYEEGLGVFDYAGNGDSLIKTDDGGTHVWAPDPIYNEETGLYYLYYCTTSTWNASNLCYGVSESVEGPYEWQGALIYSGFTEETIGATDVYDYVSEEY